LARKPLLKEEKLTEKKSLGALPAELRREKEVLFSRKGGGKGGKLGLVVGDGIGRGWGHGSPKHAKGGSPEGIHGGIQKMAERKKKINWGG